MYPRKFNISSNNRIYNCKYCFIILDENKKKTIYIRGFAVVKSYSETMKFTRKGRVL